MSKNINDYIHIDNDIEITELYNDLAESYLELYYVRKSNKASGHLVYFNLPKNITEKQLLTMIKFDIVNQGKGGIKVG